MIVSTTNEIADLARFACPVAKLHFAEPHGVGLGHSQRPCLGIGFRRNDLECRDPRRVFPKRLEFSRLAPGAQIPHQDNAARQIFCIDVCGRPALVIIIELQRRNDRFVALIRLDCSVTIGRIEIFSDEP